MIIQNDNISFIDKRTKKCKKEAIRHLLQNEIERTQEWCKDKVFTAELDHRYQSLENGTDKGYTFDELETSVSQLRKKKYG